VENIICRETQAPCAYLCVGNDYLLLVSQAPCAYLCGSCAQGRGGKEGG
jgi:hypothetical protein